MNPHDVPFEWAAKWHADNPYCLVVHVWLSVWVPMKLKSKGVTDEAVKTSPAPPPLLRLTQFHQTLHVSSGALASYLTRANDNEKNKRKNENK